MLGLLSVTFPQIVEPTIRTLGHHAKLTPHRLKIQSGDIGAVVADAAGRWFVEAEHQFGQRDFPTPDWPTIATICPGLTLIETS